jgi:hypothetical protein
VLRYFMSTHDEYIAHLYRGAYYLERINAGLLDGNGNEIGEVFVENSIFSVYHFEDDYKLLVFTNRDVTVYHKDQAVVVLQCAA